MTEVFLAQERHGYKYIFSTAEKAYEWLLEEVKDNDIDLDDPEVDYNVTDEWVYVYYDGNLVACFDKVEVDKVER